MSVIGLGGFLEGLEGFQVQALTTGARGLLSSAIRSGIEQGLSANEMLRQFQSYGAGIRRQDFLDIARNVGASMRSEEMAPSYSLYDIPSMGYVPEVEVGNLTGNWHRVDVTFSETVDGERTQFTKRIFLRTDEPITVETALNRAYGIFKEQLSSTDYEPRRFLYAQYAGVVRQTGG